MHAETADAALDTLRTVSEIDLVVTGEKAVIFENPREGKFSARQLWSSPIPASTTAVAVLDFNHDGWMDLAFTHDGAPGISLWENKLGRRDNS